MRAKRGQKEKYITPYMHDLLPESKGTKRAERVIIDFVGKKELGRVLDIGVPNPLGTLLEKYYNLKFDHTETDLDVGALSGKYDTIFCLEVIEHLFNPLHCLFQMRKILKNDGTLYITTPKCKPHFLWSKVHFHEFHMSELINLFERAEFILIRMKCMKIRPFWWYFTGLRPLLRMVFERRYLIELKK
ncbi:methyltransferase domain-containing protein [bacterium]|nr:methyltransferase domain-containing protein [bacterium]RQV93751.1 MAG: methyltransferase domain-containing protein [bacterium]